MPQSHTASAVLADLAAAASPAPPDLERARLLLVDYLAVASAGAGADSARAARRALLPGSAGPAPVLGSGQAAAVRDAALMNGISAHSLELDDTHEPSSSHPGTVIWTALLAAASARSATPPSSRSPSSRPQAASLPAGRSAPAATADVLAAAVVGYQVMASLGELLGPAELYGQGLHPTAVCGVFGAAAAAGRLAGLDAGAIRASFGIALSLAAGSMAYLSEGTWTKRFHSGSAAAGGLLAAELAAAGFTGPDDAVGDPNGLMRICGGPRPAGRVAGVLAHAERLPAVHETSVKFHPCCRYMHGVMDLLAAHVSDGGRVEGLASVDCGVLSGGVGLVADPIERKREVSTMVDAQFSLPFGAALALSRGAPSLADFQAADRVARELGPLMGLVRVHTSPALEAAYPAKWGAEVTLAFADGEVVELSTPVFRGSPGWPAGRAEVAAKAGGLVGADAAGRLLAAADALGPQEEFDPAALAAAVQA